MDYTSYTQDTPETILLEVEVIQAFICQSVLGAADSDCPAASTSGNNGKDNYNKYKTTAKTQQLSPSPPALIKTFCDSALSAEIDHSVHWPEEDGCDIKS
ncbi:hypothetical protein KUCAC02_013364, partial [Chaenocephalus aceratus]